MFMHKIVNLFHAVLRQFGQNGEVSDCMHNSGYLLILIIMLLNLI